MREISEHSRVSKPTIYYYFGSKEGIYSELLRAGFTYIQEKISGIVEKDAPVREKLTDLAKMFFEEAVLRPDYMRFFFNLATKATMEPQTLAPKCRLKETGGQILVGLIEEGVRSGEFGAAADPKLAAEIITGVIRHFVLKQSASSTIILNDQLAENIINLLFKGLNE